MLYYFFVSNKISKTFVFFLRTSSEYLTRYGQGSVVKMDPCLCIFEYSPDVLKKKSKVLDISNTDKKCKIINIESSRPEIWIRIRFLEINGSPSLFIPFRKKGYIKCNYGSDKLNVSCVLYTISIERQRPCPLCKLELDFYQIDCFNHRQKRKGVSEGFLS